MAEARIPVWVVVKALVLLQLVLFDHALSVSATIQQGVFTTRALGASAAGRRRDRNPARATATNDSAATATLPDLTAFINLVEEFNLAKVSGVPVSESLKNRVRQGVRDLHAHVQFFESDHRRTLSDALAKEGIDPTEHMQRMDHELGDDSTEHDMFSSLLEVRSSAEHAAGFKTATSMAEMEAREDAKMERFQSILHDDPIFDRYLRPLLTTLEHAQRVEEREGMSRAPSRSAWFAKASETEGVLLETNAQAKAEAESKEIILLSITLAIAIGLAIYKIYKWWKAYKQTINSIRKEMCVNAKDSASLWGQFNQLKGLLFKVVTFLFVARQLNMPVFLNEIAGGEYTAGYLEWHRNERATKANLYTALKGVWKSVEIQHMHGVCLKQYPDAGPALKSAIATKWDIGADRLNLLRDGLDAIVWFTAWTYVKLQMQSIRGMAQSEAMVWWFCVRAASKDVKFWSSNEAFDVMKLENTKDSFIKWTVAGIKYYDKFPNQNNADGKPEPIMPRAEYIGLKRILAFVDGTDPTGAAGGPGSVDFGGADGWGSFGESMFQQATEITTSVVNSKMDQFSEKAAALSSILQAHPTFSKDQIMALYNQEQTEAAATQQKLINMGAIDGKTAKLIDAEQAAGSIAEIAVNVLITIVTFIAAKRMSDQLEVAKKKSCEFIQAHVSYATDIKAIAAGLQAEVIRSQNVHPEQCKKPLPVGDLRLLKKMLQYGPVIDFDSSTFCNRICSRAERKDGTCDKVCKIAIAANKPEFGNFAIVPVIDTLLLKDANHGATKARYNAARATLNECTITLGSFNVLITKLKNEVATAMNQFQNWECNVEIYNRQAEFRDAAATKRVAASIPRPLYRQDTRGDDLAAILSVYKELKRSADIESEFVSSTALVDETLGLLPGTDKERQDEAIALQKDLGSVYAPHSERLLDVLYRAWSLQTGKCSLDRQSAILERKLWQIFQQGTGFPDGPDLTQVKVANQLVLQAQDMRRLAAFDEWAKKYEEAKAASEKNAKDALAATTPADKASTYETWVVGKAQEAVAKERMELAVQILQCSLLFNQDDAQLAQLDQTLQTAQQRALSAAAAIKPMLEGKLADRRTQLDDELTAVTEYTTMLTTELVPKPNVLPAKLLQLFVEKPSSSASASLLLAHKGMKLVHAKDLDDLLSRMKKLGPSFGTDFSSDSRRANFVKAVEKELADATLFKTRMDKKSVKWKGDTVVDLYEQELKQLNDFLANPVQAGKVPAIKGQTPVLVYRDAWAALQKTRDEKLTEDPTAKPAPKRAVLTDKTAAYVKAAAAWKTAVREEILKKETATMRSVINKFDKSATGKLRGLLKKHKADLHQLAVQPSPQTPTTPTSPTTPSTPVHFLQLDEQQHAHTGTGNDPQKPQDLSAVVTASIAMSTARLEMELEYMRRTTIMKALDLAKSYTDLPPVDALLKLDSVALGKLIVPYKNTKTMIDRMRTNYESYLAAQTLTLKPFAELTKGLVTSVTAVAANSGAVGPATHAYRQLFGYRRAPDDDTAEKDKKKLFSFSYDDAIQISPKSDAKPFQDPRFGVTLPSSGVPDTIGASVKPDPEWQACKEFTDVWTKTVQDENDRYNENKALAFEADAAAGFQERCVHSLTMRNYWPGLPSECVYWQLIRDSTAGTPTPQTLAPQGYSTFVLALLSTIRELEPTDLDAAEEQYHPVAQAVDLAGRFGVYFTRIFLAGAETAMQEAFQAAVLATVSPKPTTFKQAVTALSASTATALRRQFFSHFYDEVLDRLLSRKMHTDARCGIDRAGAKDPLKTELSKADTAAQIIMGMKKQALEVRPRLLALKMLAVESMALSPKTFSALAQARPSWDQSQTPMASSLTDPMFPLPASGYQDWSDLATKCTAWANAVANGDKGLATNPGTSIRSEHERLIAALRRDKEFAWVGLADAAKDYVKSTYGPDSIVSQMFEKKCGAYDPADTRDVKALTATLQEFWTAYPDVKHQ